VSRVDFYVLENSSEADRKRFACRLAEKAYRLGHKVHLSIDDSAAAGEIDELLWTFRDGSFVPHEVMDSGKSEVESPVTIGAVPPPGGGVELIINLAEHIPEGIKEIPRIAEIVSDDESRRRQSRERYARYRELGHTLETHKL
jgi:DNA polymerase-3 subunit chi